MRLAGKVALISGGARGIGAAQARLFAREGAKVVIGDILEEEGRRVEAEIAEAGGEALFVPLDVTREEDWPRAVETAVARYGKLDILVNNAGINRRLSLEETTEEAWEEIMAVNAKGVFLGTKHVIPEMRKAGGGSIINISSVAGLRGSSSPAAYSASKGAVHIFTKVIAFQHAKEGIRVNSIHPGTIETPMNQDVLADPAVRGERLRRIPLGRLGTPVDVAYGALYLASDESSFVTGAELVIDGGFAA